eukprot:TRINITY_DN66577_c6_g2_i1.p1 TRINITY_DN66577_c6_g2~~TRINITY_DN66577_c6_g2_i1.p1  ORF type:complete len:389 (+),score=23.48 TRINITY_DN66577_c6_g2_i1:79-1167(+)
MDKIKRCFSHKPTAAPNWNDHCRCMPDWVHYAVDDTNAGSFGACCMGTVVFCIAFFAAVVPSITKLTAPVHEAECSCLSSKYIYHCYDCGKRVGACCHWKCQLTVAVTSREDPDLVIDEATSDHTEFALLELLRENGIRCSPDFSSQNIAWNECNGRMDEYLCGELPDETDELTRWTSDEEVSVPVNAEGKAMCNSLDPFTCYFSKGDKDRAWGKESHVRDNFWIGLAVGLAFAAGGCCCCCVCFVIPCCIAARRARNLHAPRQGYGVEFSAVPAGQLPPPAHMQQPPPVHMQLPPGPAQPQPQPIQHSQTALTPMGETAPPVTGTPYLVPPVQNTYAHCTAADLATPTPPPSTEGEKQVGT